MATDATNAPETIVLVHGLWLTPLSWEKWIEHYEGKGYNVIAPAWPGMDGEIDEVRSNTKPYENLGVREIAAHYEQIIRKLDKPPIIIGHSFGGLITEVLLDRGLGAAGVGISPAPIKGILALPFSSLKVASVALKNPANRHKAVTLTPDEFRYGFGNLLSVEDSKKAYDRLAIPGPGRVLFQAAFSNFTPNSPAAVHPKNGKPRAAAADGQRQGSHGAGGGHEERLQDSAESAVADRAEGIPGSLALHLRPGRLGGRGRRCAGVGDDARRGAGRGLDQALSTSRTISEIAALSPSPCPRTSERQVAKSSAWPIAARTVFRRGSRVPGRRRVRRTALAGSPRGRGSSGAGAVGCRRSREGR